METVISWCGESPGLVGACCMVLGFFCYYLGWIAGKPKVIGAGQLKKQLLQGCPILSQYYWPTIWGFYCHVSTIMRFILQKYPNIAYKREILSLDDGGEVGLDWGVSEDASSSSSPESLAKDTPVLLILPGITGNSMDNYILHLVEDGLLQGYRPVVFNQRGNGGIKLKTLRTYSGSSISDLFQVVQYIHTLYPEASIVGIGVSLGGMILTQYLHRLGKECDVSAAIAISVCWDPFVTRRSLEDDTVNKHLYSRVMVSGIKRLVRSNLEDLTESELEDIPLDVKGILQAEVVSEIDTHLTAPVFGYSSLEDYYKDCKNSDKLHRVCRPLVCITSADDPFVPYNSLPFNEFESNPHTLMVLTLRGGHFGFIEGVYPRHKTWMNRAVQQILQTFKTELISKS